jgi:hypothetical protein
MSKTERRLDEEPKNQTHAINIQQCQDLKPIQYLGHRPKPQNSNYFGHVPSRPSLNTFYYEHQEHFLLDTAHKRPGSHAAYGHGHQLQHHHSQWPDVAPQPVFQLGILYGQYYILFIYFTWDTMLCVQLCLKRFQQFQVSRGHAKGNSSERPPYKGVSWSQFLCRNYFLEVTLFDIFSKLRECWAEVVSTGTGTVPRNVSVTVP